MGSPWAVQGAHEDGREAIVSCAVQLALDSGPKMREVRHNPIPAAMAKIQQKTTTTGSAVEADRRRFGAGRVNKKEERERGQGPQFRMD